jgi:hypothetical protein
MVGPASGVVRQPPKPPSPGPAVPLLSSLFLGTLLVLLVAAALRLRVRLREPLATPLLDDAAIRAIETTGRVDLDDELDLAVIEEEERRFWEDGPADADEEEWEQR